MSDVIVQLPLDKTGRDPNNLVGSEEHTLSTIAGFPYKIITLMHGGFYLNDLRVFDAAYNRLIPNEDYIVTYFHKDASEFIGLDICSAIVFLDKTRTGKVYTSAQMVGGDLAYSFTVIDDYISFYRNQGNEYIPQWKDFNGTEPIWGPGELEAERWKLDTYQPFNNEIEQIARAYTGQIGGYEEAFRVDVEDAYEAFLSRFNDRLDRHIADLENPHVDTKEDVGLELVNNFLLATSSQAAAGVVNDRYMTPQLNSVLIEEQGNKPLQAHINIKGANPHGVTPAQLNAPTKEAVNTLVNTKYNRNEVVEGANQANWNGQMTYDMVLSAYRSNIPAAAFTQDLVPPGRLGRGTPNQNAVLRGTGYWTNWEAILAEYGKAGTAGEVAWMAGTIGMSQAQVTSLIATTAPFNQMPVGSLIFYYIRESKSWGSGNGIWTGALDTMYATMNVANQGWVSI